ncbi:nucleotide sugar dehydrogenase [Pseudonocardia spirodelae]|uniref:Nucleotide sugar dehydrogenase n=1 Tax=Pseudonocardia spirodelae TaxID=3133431 RepID=A0ABU8T2U9_9PSEU
MDVIAPPCRVAVLGQGYVGLPVATRAVEAGYDVVGFDVDKARVDRLVRARSYVDDVTDDDLRRVLDTARFHPTGDEADLAGFDVAVVSVPTPLRDGAPDLGHVRDAALLLARHVRPGCTVVLESTTYPGTTEDEFVPLLESAGRWRAGRDFHVGYSPERIDPGNRNWTFRTTPKIVSGVDAASREAVAAFYRTLVERVVEVAGTREAELAKLLENTFRHVNIALVNELAVLGHDLGVDVWSVIDAAATKPFGFMPFRPGPGVGGHCLPIDPSYLSWQVRRSLGQTFRFVEIANDVNDHMPDHVVGRVAARLNRDRRPVNGSRILLLGLAYKRNSGDARHSPAISVARRLADRGAVLHAVDPLIDPDHVPPGVTMVGCTDDELAAADLVVVLTDHDVLDWELVGRYAERVFDTRNRLGAAGCERL